MEKNRKWFIVGYAPLLVSISSVMGEIETWTPIQYKDAVLKV